jgi:hypothetical protein
LPHEHCRCRETASTLRFGTIGVVGQAQRARSRAVDVEQPRRNSGIGVCASVLKRAAGALQEQRLWRFGIPGYGALLTLAPVLFETDDV